MTFSFGPFDEAIPLDPSEYGGKSGLVQSAADGHELTVGEEQGIVQRVGAEGEGDVDVVTGLPVPVTEEAN